MVPSGPTYGDAFGGGQSRRALPQCPLAEQSEPKPVAQRCWALSGAFDLSPGFSDARWDRIQLPLYRRVPSVTAVSAPSAPQPAFVLVSLEARDGASC